MPQKILVGFFALSLLSLGSFLFFQKANVIEVFNLFDASSSRPKPLANPPETVKAIYATNWSAGSEKKMDYLINLIETTELNSIVVDIKDYTGYVGFDSDLELVKKYNAVQKRILDIDDLVNKLHGKDIYVIARICVFQDQQLSKARPDLALKNKKSGAIWADSKGLAWLDPASKEVWDYNIAIAKDVLSHGFDEINFDYIRFPSDGNLKNADYPYWDEKIPKSEIMRQFFEYTRNQLPDAKISADIFGQVLIDKDDSGIGQHFENILPYFDFIAPMVYPSHYASGFLGFKNPATAPYEVVKYSMELALQRIKAYELKIKNEISSTTPAIHDLDFKIRAKIRPWLQDFDLGADYDAGKIKNQIQALYHAASTTPELIQGWMLWNSSNIYTKEALLAD